MLYQAPPVYDRGVALSSDTAPSGLWARKEKCIVMTREASVQAVLDKLVARAIVRLDLYENGPAMRSRRSLATMWTVGWNTPLWVPETGVSYGGELTI